MDELYTPGSNQESAEVFGWDPTWWGMPIDEWGPDLEAQVWAFQQGEALEPTGLVDEATFRRLWSIYEGFGMPAEPEECAPDKVCDYLLFDGKQIGICAPTVTPDEKNGRGVKRYFKRKGDGKRKTRYKARKDGRIDRVGVHWTGTRSAHHTWIAAWSTRRSVSTHLEIDWNGVIWQLVDLKHRAYHYGIGWFNDRSIGLDLTNPAGYNKTDVWNRRLVELGQPERPIVRGYRLGGWRPKPFLGATEAQLESLRALMVCLHEHVGVPMVAPADLPGQPRMLKRLKDVQDDCEESRRRMPPGWYHHCQGRKNRYDHLGLELTRELTLARAA
jgi:hypothetical protein